MPSIPHIDRIDLPCPRLPPGFDGFTMLHLSDLHLAGWSPRLEGWRDMLAALQPELIAITGDLGHRAWGWPQTRDSVLRLLEPLQPPLGTYFILGNHDALKLAPALTGRGLRFLQNEAALITRADARLALIGVHQHRRIDTDIPLAMRDVRPGDFKVVMLHYPDLVYQAAAAGADVCLAGHTHGGQICWPDGAPIIRHDTLPALMCTGVHRVNGTWMVVNRGIGKAGLRLRMFCPPHAIMVTLRRGEGLPRGR
jgi:predicted MPP superfamily phosphohydrolase